MLQAEAARCGLGLTVLPCFFGDSVEGLRLHPNALYAQIEVDYEKEAITLIRGHNYPSPEIKNGFEWKFDNTHPYEYDTDCEDWDFIQIDNGIMLNCYPEKIIFQDERLLKAIKEY